MGTIANNCSIRRDEFFNALKLIFDSTYFVFDGVIYKQNFRILMGSPLSPIISDLVMRDLEERALEALGFSPPFYSRYCHPRLQFTAEIGELLNFLDVTIIKNKNYLEFNIISQRFWEDI